MLRRLISALPAPFIRFVGRLQFRIPFLRPLIERAAGNLAEGEGTIRHGVGAGLRFNATGGNVGYLLGTTEPEEQAALAGFLKPGAVFYDIGANIGFYSTIAARLVGETGHVYAFEPFPISATAVQTNASLNGFSNVTVVVAAVTNEQGVVSLAISDASRKHRVATTGENGNIDVRSIRMDSYVTDENLRPPDVVMIDVEGAEVDVLKGMLETIRNHRPTIMCEVHWILDELYDFCRTELNPLGYELRTLTGEPLPTTQAVRYHALLIPS